MAENTVVSDIIWGAETGIPPDGYALPQASEFTFDRIEIGNQSRSWNGTLRKDIRSRKRTWTVRWDGTTHDERSEIEAAWNEFSGSPTPFQFPNGDTAQVMGSIGGYTLEPRYNPLRRYWRYRITINLVEA